MENRQSSSSLSDFILNVLSPHKSQTNTTSSTIGILWNSLPGHDGGGVSVKPSGANVFRETSDQTAHLQHLTP